MYGVIASYEAILVGISQPLQAKRQQFSDRLLNWRMHFSSQDHRVATREGFASLLRMEADVYADIEASLIEPGWAFFRMLRERTGVSLDWLIEGQ